MCNLCANEDLYTAGYLFIKKLQNAKIIIMIIDKYCKCVIFIVLK